MHGRARGPLMSDGYCWRVRLACSAAEAPAYPGNPSLSAYKLPMGAAPSHSSGVAGGDSGGSPGATTQAPRRPALGSRPGHVGDAPPPGYDMANTAASRVVATPSLFTSRLREKPPAHSYPAPVQQQAVVTNVCNLKKGSLRLVHAEKADGSPDPDLYLVEFEFDAKVDGFITVYFAATQTLKRAGNDKAARVEGVSFRGLQGRPPSKTRFSAGTGKKYRQNAQKGLNVKNYTDSDLIYSADRERYPIVIRLEAVYPADSLVPEAARVQMQISFATLTGPDEHGEYSCALLRQEVLVDGTLFKIQDLYGINGSVSGEVEDDGEGFTVDNSSGNECVICLTEPCSIAVRPCNHLCLCDDCADVLLNDTNFERRRCPICRSPLGSLLRIISTVPSPEASEDGGSGGISAVGSESGVGSSSTAAGSASEGDTRGNSAVVAGDAGPCQAVDGTISRPIVARTIASNAR